MSLKTKLFTALFLIVTAVSAGVIVPDIFNSKAFAEETKEERDTRLRAELAQVEKEIADQQKILDTKKSEGTSIQRDLAIINAKIAEAQLKIKKHNIVIEQLGKDITVRTNTISKLDNNIESGEESLAQILRKTNELDGHSLPEVILGSDDLSTFFADLDSFDSVKSAIAVTFSKLRDAKESNETEKVVLSKKRNSEIDTRINVESEKKKIQVAEAEKKRLLNLNKTEQNGYQKVIAEKAAKAAQIRAALFGLRDSEAIPFGTALTYAKSAAVKTGTRPAFVLAILTQESNLGANVGSCYLTDKDTGAGVRVSTGVAVTGVMKPTRDVAPFIDITTSLGRDWTKTRVSCPFSIGYGGAMGPAQFIPSTWNIFKTRIANALNAGVADPWNAEHAFMASSMYLSDLGAVSGSYTAERNAACKYYSGKACGGATNTFYGDQVMAKVAAIQANIDILEGN